MTKLKPPLISIRDSSDTQIGVLLDYFNDSIERYLEGKVSILTLSALDENNNRELLSEGNFLSFTYNGEDYHLTIVKKDEDEDVITITAWSLVLELNNETKNPYTGSNMTFEQYMNAFDGERILKLNINEVSGKKISHKWDSQQTMLERLFSLATVFDAEIEFESILAEDGSLKELQVNVYKAHNSTNQGIGKNRSAEVFYFGEDITTVKKSTSIMNLYTAIRPIGKDGLTLNGYKMDDVKDKDGQTLFFLKNGMIYAPRARELYPSNLINKGDRWTVYDWDTEYDSQAALCGNALAKLRDELSTPAITWTIEGYIEANIGDTITVYDDGYKPTLLLEARINSQRISMTDPSSNETTFSNIEQVESQISEDLISRMNAMIAENAEYIANMATTNGTTFKNANGSTILKAKVYMNGKDITDKVFIQWFKDDVHISNEKEILVEASQIKNSSIYRFEVYDSLKKFKAEAEATITNISETQFVYSPNEPSNRDNVIWVDTTNPNNNETKYWDDETRQWISTTPTDPAQIGAVSENFAKELSKRLSDIENPILYPNTVFNSSFERFDENFKPDFWKTEGRVSTLEALSGSYSLRLEGGQTLLTDKQPITPYKWANLSTLFVLRAIGKGKIKVEVVNDGTPLTIGRWVDDKTYKSDTSFTFEINSFNWIDSKRSVELPKTNSAVLLKITCVEGTVYLDNISAVPIEYKSRLEINYVHGPMNYNDIMTLREDDLPNAKLGAMWFRTQN